MSKEHKLLPGSIRMCRYHGTETGVHIELLDEASGTIVTSVYLTTADFGSAVTGMTAPCRFEMVSQVVGKVREVKDEIVPVKGKPHYSLTDADKDELLAPFEVDGWKGSRYDLGNSHRLVGAHENRSYKVGFVRYVDPQPVVIKKAGAEGKGD